MDSKFDWVAVNLTSSGSGQPFGQTDRVGARVTVGLRMPDSVREIEVPVLIENGGDLTIAQARNAALDEAVNVLRNLLRDLDGQTYEQLAARQDQQDAEREEQFNKGLTASIRSGSRDNPDQD